MLVSPSANLAFAHFPKTAGTSLAALLQEAFPDARWIDSRDVHVGVAEGLLRLRGRVSPLCRWSHRLRGRALMPSDVEVGEPESLRVLGVVRDPFEMAVSLFEYWHRKLDERDLARSPLLAAAHRGDYLGFLRLIASDESRFPTYRQFFDQGGALWSRTILVDFADLQGGLARAFGSLGLQVDLSRLARRNDSRRPDGGMRRRELEAGDLAEAVRRRYRREFSPPLVADTAAPCAGRA